MNAEAELAQAQLTIEALQSNLRTVTWLFALTLAAFVLL